MYRALPERCRVLALRGRVHLLARIVRPALRDLTRAHRPARQLHGAGARAGAGAGAGRQLVQDLERRADHADVDALHGDDRRHGWSDHLVCAIVPRSEQSHQVHVRAVHLRIYSGEYVYITKATICS